jgi:hypothetical protein
MPPRIFLGLAVTLLIAGCGSSSGSPAASTPRATTSGLNARHILARDTRLLAAQSYTVDYHVVSLIPLGTPLYVFHSICTGSADGHCQAVDVFRGDESKSMWHGQYVGVRALRAAPNGFVITATSYASQDPLCCPSLPNVTDTYTWNGSGFDERGPLPKAPGS